MQVLMLTRTFVWRLWWYLFEVMNQNPPL